MHHIAYILSQAGSLTLKLDGDVLEEAALGQLVKDAVKALLVHLDSIAFLGLGLGGGRGEVMCIVDLFDVNRIESDNLIKPNQTKPNQT